MDRAHESRASFNLRGVGGSSGRTVSNRGAQRDRFEEKMCDVSDAAMSSSSRSLRPSPILIQFSFSMDEQAKD